MCLVTCCGLSVAAAQYLRQEAADELEAARFELALDAAVAAPQACEDVWLGYVAPPHIPENTLPLMAMSGNLIDINGYGH